MHGNVQSYLFTRWMLTNNPHAGDGGSDIPGANVDFKSSLMRNNPDPLDYRLAVRPGERHAGTVYILILIELDEVNQSGTAHLVGWLAEKDLPAKPEASGTFKGAFVVSARELKPLMPLQWKWTG